VPSSGRCTLRADRLLERTGFTVAELRRALGLAVLAAAAAAAVGLALAIVGEVRDINGVTFTREPQFLGDLPWYAGFLSTLGVLVWVAGVGAVGTMACTPQLRSHRWVYALPALLALAMAIDDIYLLHDVVYPVSESVVQLAYFTAIAAILVVFRDRLPSAAVIGSLGAVGLWAASALMDRSLNESGLNFDQLTEDTLKFAGIAVWTVGWIVAVLDTNRGVRSA
jgi:hypothetical protein